MKQEEELERLVADLISQPQEAEWLEFKENKVDPDEIGRTLSALSNSAALLDFPRGFIIWGVEDETQRLVGTSFRPRETKGAGNEDLENWLSRNLRPDLDLRIHEGSCEGQPVVVFEVPAAKRTLVKFKDVAHVRVGSYTKKLFDYPDKEIRLWAVLSKSAFEDGIAKTDATEAEVLSLLDFRSYFELIQKTVPDNTAAVEAFAAEKLIVPSIGGRFNVTNLGAILFAKDLGTFNLSRKGVRVVVYRGLNRVQTLREQTGEKGYAVGFRGLIGYVNNLLPQNEQIRQALRIEQKMYPEVAIRELVANALIHQDFSMIGTGPKIEIFDDRMEITNPGEPLVETMRFIDAPPQSRNDVLASLMRRLKICEERGSGIDKVISLAETFQLPAPDFRVVSSHTQAVLFAYRPFSKMKKEERMRACYQHAVLLYVSNQQMTNASLRKRFSISDENYPIASRVISDTVRAGLIKPADPESKSRKHAKYLPIWA